MKKTLLLIGAILAAFVGSAEGLPKEYVQVESIESTKDGKEHLDTGYCPTANTRIVADMTPFEKVGDFPVFFGVTGDDSPTNGVLLRYYNTADSSQRGINGWFCNENVYDAYLAWSENVRLTAELQAGRLKINEWTGPLTTTGTPYDGPLYIFCCNNGGKPWRHQAMRLYSFKAYEGDALVADMTPCVERTSGSYGLYDLVRGRFCPMVRTAEGASVSLVEDDETLGGNVVYPGQVLKHNHVYRVSDDKTIDASAMPGVSAVRVPIGAAVVIDIAAGKTLTVIGGPGCGRIPGGAGIEVPRGAKLVVTGGENSHLIARGGAAAVGGTGYGGMGGQFSYIKMSANMDPAHSPYASMPQGQSDITNNEVAASSFASNALYFARTGDGGNGGDGGGGAGAGIGTRGGVGGLGGVGAVGKFVTGGEYYKGEEKRYADFSRFFGIDPGDWLYYGESGNASWDGLDGGNGGNGGAALSCGEIIVTGDVAVQASSGADGAGGANGPFGSTAQAYDKNAKGEHDISIPDSKLNVSSLVIGGAGTIGGIVCTIKGLAGTAATIAGAAGGILGGVSAVLALASIINDAVNDDKSVMKKQLWFVGGGGGGGGGGGAAGAGIGAGGYGGGAGGAGGGGFFEIGVNSVYTMKGGIIGENVDATTPPLPLSAHGGAGGAGTANLKGGDGRSATSFYRGEAEATEKGSKGNVYNYFGFHGADKDMRLGAASWHEGAQAWGGRGGKGGDRGAGNTADISLFYAESSRIEGFSQPFEEKNKLADKSVVSYGVEYYAGVEADEAPVHAGRFICGTIVESAPVMERPGYYFQGYYTEKDGKGVRYFDRFRNSPEYPKITKDLKLYAKWTDAKPESEGFTSSEYGSNLKGGDTLADRTIYRFTQSQTLTGAAGNPGLRVASGTTAVIYLDHDAVVTCIGANGSNATPGYPGIEVPEGATLIVTGTGKLVAQGGNGGAGTQGGAGGDAKIHTENGGWGYGGNGGAGGAGGGGAAPGIGGAGGNGGDGGGGGVTKVHDCSNTDFVTNGPKGNDGKDGGTGAECGTVFILGQVDVAVKSGNAGTGGAGGGFGGYAYKQWTNHYIAAGGGGGGGGAGGRAPACPIGGGGGGGSGGGGGGGGFTQYEQQPGGWEAERGDGGGISACGGFGDKGGSDGKNGGQGKWNTLKGRYGDYVGGGAGGTNGGNGACGKNGALYVNEKVKMDLSVFESRGEDVDYAFGHPALERTLTFRLDGTDTTPETNIAVAAQIGMALPVLPDSCVRPVSGYVLAGAYQLADGKTNWWYKAKGEPAIGQYDGIDDVTLHVVYALDVERLVDAPTYVNTPYDGSNHVAFVAAKNPGCTFLAGVTNGTETGAREYTVRLDDDYSNWSDFFSNRVRTVTWEITRATITNEWVDNAVTYDWTKSRADNLFALTNNPAKTLGFKLPPDAHVTFELGEQIQVNVQRLVVTVSGMRNHFDKRYYGTFSCAQPFQLLLKPHYPWAAKLDIFCAVSSWKISEMTKDEFKAVYGNCPILAQVHIPDGTNGTRIVTLNAEGAYRVRDIEDSGFQSKCMTVDLMQVKGLEGVRAYALPVYVSLDGQVFQGGSTTIDTTASERNGCPLYTVHDVNDIFDIECSVTFVDSGIDVKYDMAGRIHTLLAVGKWDGQGDMPGERFVPQTASGNVLVNDCVQWTPTQEGKYMLEHWVVNPDDAKAVDGMTGYRRAYFDFCGKGGEKPQTVRNPIVRVKLKRASTGATVGYTSLAAALAGIQYGDEVVIVRDVQMETEKVPSGSTVRVEDNGVFRSPVDGDFRTPYNTAEVLADGNGKVTNVVYRLDEEKVRVSLAGGEAFGLSADGTAFGFTLDNVKPDLYYVVRRSEDIRTWTVVQKVAAAGREGSVPVSVPAGGSKGFYSVVVTDDPAPRFLTDDDGKGGVVITGSELFANDAFAGKMVIPSEILGKAVSGVANGAFRYRSDILSLDVTAGVAAIGDSAFRDCVNLHSVTLVEGLETIGDCAFDGADIGELVIPASVRAVGTLDLRKLKTLRFLGRPESVGELRLSPDCIVYVPQNEGWTGVPAAAWHGGQLEYWVDFTYKVENEMATITGCGAIPSDGRLRIPGTIGGMRVTAIGAEAFRDRGANELAEVIVSEGVKNVGAAAFHGCAGLVTAEFPTSLVGLGQSVFGDSGNRSFLTSLTFRGDSPDYDGDVGLDPAKCTIHVPAGSSGWGETWQGCLVVRRNGD